MARSEMYLWTSGGGGLPMSVSVGAGPAGEETFVAVGCTGREVLVARLSLVAFRVLATVLVDVGCVGRGVLVAGLACVYF